MNGGTAFDITPLMVPYLDTHMIIPMLDFLRDPNSVLRDEKSTNEDKVTLLQHIMQLSCAVITFFASIHVFR